jgi:hypothetical protein
MNQLNHDLFISALVNTQLVKVTFKSNEKGILTRTCVPMDHGHWRRSSTYPDIRYHFMDLDSSSGIHPLPIKPENIINMELLQEKFEPGNIVNWVPDWHIARDWGIYS